MFIDIVIIFVPVLLGGVVGNAVALISEKPPSKSLARAGIATGAAIGYQVLVVALPFYGLWTELICFLAATFTIVLLMIPLPLGSNERAVPGNQAGCATIIVIPFFCLAMWTNLTRVGISQRLSVDFDGRVTSKFESHNHGEPSIIVTAPDGSTTEFEGMERTTWDAIVEGKSRVAKPAWSAMGQLDGKLVRFVTKRNALFGPFPE